MTRKLALAGLMMMLAALPSATLAGAEEWQHTVVLYGMGAAIDGTAQIADLEVPVDISVSELFAALEMGAMGAYRADNGTWSFMADATFMGLGGTDTTAGGRLKGDLDLDQMTLMTSVGRRWTDHVEFLFGLAYVDLSTELALTGTVGEVVDRQAAAKVDWVDPTVGLAYNRPFAERWRLNLRGDVGGFSVGSDLMLHLLANVRWQTSETVGVVLGYRLISFDYADGEGLGYQRYDLTEQGPLVGVSFSF